MRENWRRTFRQEGRTHEFHSENVKGILLCLVLAIPCWFLGQAVPVVGGPVFGILAGMLITLLLKDKTQFQSGITFVSKRYCSTQSSCLALA